MTKIKSQYVRNTLETETQYLSPTWKKVVVNKNLWAHDFLVVRFYLLRTQSVNWNVLKHDFGVTNFKNFPGGPDPVPPSNPPCHAGPNKLPFLNLLLCGLGGLRNKYASGTKCSRYATDPATTGRCTSTETAITIQYKICNNVRFSSTFAC